MDRNEEPSEELIRELYARFGLAYYLSECLHRELCYILPMSRLPRKDLVTRPRVEERLAYAFSRTLGEVARQLEDILPDDLLAEIRRAVEQRNFLAHRFWFERAHLMSTVDGISTMIEELDDYSGLFERLDERATAWYDPKQRALGISDGMIEKCLKETIAGKPWDPLPSKRLPKKRERLVRVWELVLPDGSKPLVFETDDGALWQLCDAGLGWTHFEEVRPDWKEHPAVKPFLPAEIVPRPEGAKPWEYDFRLNKGAVLWVKPGSRENTFRWGVRTKPRPAQPHHTAPNKS